MSKISIFEQTPAALTAWERGLPPSRPVTGVLGTLLLGGGTDTVPKLPCHVAPRALHQVIRPLPSQERGLVYPQCPKVRLPAASTGRAASVPPDDVASKGHLEAHPDPRPGPGRVLAALVGVLSVQLLRLHELLQRLVDALSGLRGQQRPRYTHCHVSANRDRDSR